MSGSEANFGKWFPDNESVQTIHIENSDPTRVLTIVAGQSVRLEEVYELYAEGSLTFSQFAALAGKNEVALWSGLVGQPKRRLIASFGDLNEQRRHFERAQKAQSIALDLTALLTSAYLDTLPLLPKRFAKIYLPQVVFDTLSLHIIDLRTIGSAGFKSLSFEDGRFLWSEVPKSSVEANIQHTEKIRQFVRDYCEIVPLAPGVIPFLARGEEGFLPAQNSMATLLVAQQTRSFLYSDDRGLRHIAESTMGILGFWTQPLLDSMTATGQVSKEEFFEKSIRLIRAHYYFTAINSGLLAYLWRKSNLQSSHEVEDALRTLQGPYANANTAIKVVATFLRDMWLGIWLNEQKVFVLDQCLKVLVAHREGLIVIQKLIHLLDRDLRLQLAPIHHDELLREIHMWRKLNLK